jgi:Xaa-Pro aminopeptidase
MIDRRGLMTGALASLASPALLHAQVLPPPGYGRPSGTFPFEPEVFRQRRARVLAALKTGVAVLYGAEPIHTSAAVGPRFQQDPDFAWLTGIVEEPGAILILAPAERQHREILLLPSRNPEVERWDVERLPLGSELERRSGFERVGRTSELGGLVTGLAARHKELRFLGPVVQPTAPVPPALDLYGRVSQRVPGTRITDDSRLLPSMRIVKEPRELDQMRRAIAATRRGHLAAMRQVRPGWTERQLRDLVEAEFRAGGGQELGYESIVASGRNAASLHYTGGGGVIRPGSLILIDAGASVGGYASDVTRTFPVDGRFTPEQRRTYELVLAAQEAAASRLRAGVYFADLSEAAKQVFRQAGRIDDFYHGLGHLVGLHVHDAGDLSQPLPAGAVITIEPGLYVQSENYGVRIEDQYLVTATGAERMSTGIPRTVAEIESFMATPRR